MAEAVGFEPTCPCGQLHFECSSLQPLRYASVYKYSLSGTNHMISSQPRYDHFDTSPCMSNGLCRLLSVHVLEIKHIVVDIHAHFADAHTALDLHPLNVLMNELLDLIGLADVLERKLRDALIR